MVGIHFKIRRSLANGISLSGSGVGSFLLPNLMRLMLNAYGLSGCLLILGALLLNVCACALLFRPLSSYSKNKRAEKRYSLDKKEENTGLEHLIEENKNNSSSKSHLQIRDQDSWKSDHSEFASLEYLPIASLLSIPGSLVRENSMGLCAKFRRSKDKTGAEKTVKKKGQKLFNWSLLSNPLFLIYAVACGLGNFAYPNIFLMLPAHAESVSLIIFFFFVYHLFCSY